MPYIEDHHNCCGAKHLVEFGDGDDIDDWIDFERENVRDIRELRGDYPMAREFTGRDRDAINPRTRKMIEVILNREQVENLDDTITALKEEGFRLVTEFNNSSGSDCFVFHRHNSGIRDRRPAILDQVFPLGELAQIVVPAEPNAPEAPRTVFSTFHCVFADGRRGAGYDTAEEARDNLGRRRRIDKRNVMSDGTQVWEVNV